jgi:hypothetical protein
MKTVTFIAWLVLLPSLAYSAECQRSEGQTAVGRAAQLTLGKEAITASQQAEILACLTLAAETTETTIKGLREGEIPFKAIRYEAMPADADK